MEKTLFDWTGWDQHGTAAFTFYDPVLKQPIGKFSHSKSFTNHEMTLIHKDEIYILTDGFQDQFGGEKGKKFKSNQLKEILILNSQKTMQEKLNFGNKFNQNWRK